MKFSKILKKIVNPFETETNKSVHKVSLKNIDYEPKIIIAWSKALEGNKEIAKWLNENGYEELNHFNAAVFLNQESRDWLMNNGYAHLMALINASEGHKVALDWLEKNNMNLLWHISQAVDNDQDSQKWIKLNTSLDIQMLTFTMQKIKNQIEENHNDIHTFGRD